MEQDWVYRGTVEHYRDAVLYDYEYRRRRHDVRFYKKAAVEYANDRTVLELACGSGRVTKAIARAGVNVDALDISLPMLSRCQTRLAQAGHASRKRVHIVKADMRDFCFEKKYPLILMAFNSFEHLYTRGDVERCLVNIKKHLEPGGRFIFDVQNPDLAWLIRNPEKRWARTRFKHPETGEPLVYSSNHIYDPVSQIVLISIYYDPNEKVGVTTTRSPSKKITLAQRKFFPAELEALLASNGFVMEARYGDFEEEELSGDAESQVLVCRLRSSR